MKIIYKYILVIVLFNLVYTFNSFSQTNNKKITIEDIWTKYTFSPSYADDLNSMNDGESYSSLLGNEIIKYNYKTGKEIEKIINLDDIKSEPKPAKINDYEFNSNETKLLFTTEKERIYRHSFRATYWVCDIKNKTVSKVSEGEKQQLATFSPDGNKLCFVRENNIFIKNLINGEETQITTDGQINSIINGIPDWVYEEEFGFSKAFEWSPDGMKLAYYKFDESKVKEYTLAMYDKLYPEQSKYKYPKAGEENSIVTIHVYDLNSKKTTQMFIGEEKDQYIPRIKWTEDANVLSIIRLNRLQNKYELLLADATSGNSKAILTETDKCYIEIDDNLTFTDDKKSFIKTSEKDGFNHLYLYDINGNLINQITKGNWEVTAFHGYDSNNKVLYYSSTEESPLKRDLYSIKLNGTNKVKMTNKSGTNQTSFSKGYKYYVNTYNNANTPAYTALYDIKGKEIRVLETNEELIKKMTEYGFSKREFFKFTTPDGIELNGWIIKPIDFDAAKKYPVFMNVYGGPGSQEVADSWDSHAIWFQMLAQSGYIVACVDNRGTGFRGAEFRKTTYRQLGKYEVDDQIEAAKYLGTLNYVDAKRIGIWGWSYGGYMTCLCLTKGADVFKMGIAVASVTNWRYYDSIYTERYDGLPQDNTDGYDNNAPMNYADKLKGKLLLIHGTADDNVHIQNTMEFIKKLTAANIQFEMQFYPNSNHSIYTGKNTRYHLYKRMTDFIMANL